MDKTDHHLGNLGGSHYSAAVGLFWLAYAAAWATRAVGRALASTCGGLSPVV